MEMVEVMAAVLAAVPLSSPCVVSVVGVIELMVVKGEVGSGLLFAALSAAPLAFADTAFYMEVLFPFTPRQGGRRRKDE